MTCPRSWFDARDASWAFSLFFFSFFGLLLTQTMYSQTNCLNLGTRLAQIQVSDTLLLVTAPTKRATYWLLGSSHNCCDPPCAALRTHSTRRRRAAGPSPPWPETEIWTSRHIDPSQNKVQIMSERPDSETSQNTTLFFLFWIHQKVWSKECYSSKITRRNYRMDVQQQQEVLKVESQNQIDI